jgi:hypothetical protein
MHNYQHANRTFIALHYVRLFMACLFCPIPSNYLHRKGQNFQKEIFDKKNDFISHTNLSENFLSPRRKHRDITINLCRSSYKMYVIFVIF